MPVAVRLFFLVLSFLGAHAEAVAQSVPALKCVTFNMLHGGVFSGLKGNAQDLDRRLAMAAKELHALGADIIGIQEASTGWSRRNVVERLVAQLGFHHVYAPASFRLFGSEWINTFISWVMNFTEGPAIISRFPIVASEAHDLPRCGRFTDPRVLLYVELRTPWGLVPVSSTHISRDACPEQAKSIVDFLYERRGSLPMLLMGDFNAIEDSPPIAVLTQAGFVDTFRVANPTAPGLTVWQRVTIPYPTVSRRVDYLFLLPGKDFGGRVLSSRVVLNSPQHFPDGTMLWPSDHYGVLTEMEMVPPSP